GFNAGGGRASRRSEDSPGGSGRGHFGIRPGTYRRSGGVELADAIAGRGAARPRERARARRIAGALRDRERCDRDSLWRQQQLVRGMGILATEILRAWRRADHERRAKKVAGGKAAGDNRGGARDAGELSRAAAG